MHKITFLLLFICSLCHCQHTTVDSLKQQLTTITSPKEEISLLRSIGFEYFDAQVYYDSALFYAKKGHAIARENDLTLEQAQTLFDQAMVYGSIQQWDKSIALYKQSIVFCKKGDIKRGLSSAYNNIGAIYVEEKDFELAKKYYNLALDIAEDINDKESIAVAYLNLGEISFFEEDLITSREKIELSQHIFDSLGYTPPSVYTFLAKTYSNLGNYDLAEAKALQGAALSKSEGDLKYSYENAITLSELYEYKKDFEKANSYSKQAMLFNDSIISAKKLNEVEKLELRFKLAEQDEKLARLEEKNNYLTTIYVLGALGVLLLIILVSRQLKIVRMTKGIHDIQNRLIKSELDLRDKKASSTFDATLAGDKDSSEEIL